MAPFTFYEFFAGGGMASQGLGAGWRCLFANDIDAAKAASYRANNDPKPFRIGDVNDVSLNDLPGVADLAWASFPCQDLSLAGNGAGLKGARSGMFWPFWRLMERLADAGRAPAIIAIENVYGAITSRGGRDLATIADAYAALGYRFACAVIDAVHFVPQSRPRLFVVGVRSDLASPPGLSRSAPLDIWTPAALTRTMTLFSAGAKKSLFHANLQAPPLRNASLADLIDDEPSGVRWHSRDETRHLLSLMAGTNRHKVQGAMREKSRRVGALYRRTRPDGAGGRAQRAEVRFDGLAGCLRTPAGGSSRQTIVIVEGKSVRTRLISPREAARLMGLDEDYILPQRYNAAHHLLGDGVVAPVVRFLAAHVFEPVLTAARRLSVAA